MNVGLPGTGIGGLFYLITALLMPVVELVRLLRGLSSLERWKVAVEQWMLAVGILAGLWTTSLVLRILFPSVLVHRHVGHGRMMTTTTGSRLFGVTPTVVSFAALAGIVIAAEFVSLILCRRKSVGD